MKRIPLLAVVFVAGLSAASWAQSDAAVEAVEQAPVAEQAAPVEAADMSQSESLPAVDAANPALRKRWNNLTPQQKRQYLKNHPGGLGRVRRAERRERQGERLENRGEQREERGERMEQRGENLQERGEQLQQKAEEVGGAQGERMERAGERMERRGERIEDRGERLQKQGDRMQKRGQRRQERAKP